MAAMIENDRSAIRKRLMRSRRRRSRALLATDLADYLVGKGLPFRQAHHAVGAVVALAEKKGKRLNQLSLAELQSVEKKFDRDAPGVFDLQKAMGRRNLPGAPGARELAKQLARWRKELS